MPVARIESAVSPFRHLWTGGHVGTGDLVHNAHEREIARELSKYKLPPAEYVYHGNIDANGLLEAVKTVAVRIGRGYGVFATEGVPWVWNGLDKTR